MRALPYGRARWAAICPILLSLAGSPAFAGDAQSVTTDANGKKVILAVVDEAKLLKLPPGTSTLLIGNPTIADVSLLPKNNMAVLLAKAFGETNFIALDANGNVLAESIINVAGGTNALVVQRGMDRESYSCAPRCQPTERLGDDDKYLNTVSTQAQAHRSRLTGSVAPTDAPMQQSR